MTLAARFLALTPQRRALAFEQAAAGQAGQAVMLEKDFWVSWLTKKLLAHGQSAQFLSDHQQCARVVDWKARVFARAWARYDLAQPGSFRLVPPVERHSALAQDYADMQPMFMTEPPPFPELMKRLAHAESSLNKT